MPSQRIEASGRARAAFGMAGWHDSVTGMTGLFPVRIGLGAAMAAIMLPVIHFRDLV